MLDLAQALERYTVIQLLAATPVMLIVWMIIREVRGVVKGGSNNQMQTAFETIGVVAGNNENLTNKMQDVGNTLQDVGKSIATVSNNQDGILKTNEKIVAVVERLFIMFSDTNKEDKKTRQDIAELKANSDVHHQDLDKTKKVVEVMSTDVDKIKITLGEITQQLTLINQRQESGEKLSQKHQDTLELILEKLKRLEPETKAITQPIEPPQADIETDEAPKIETKEGTK